MGSEDAGEGPLSLLLGEGFSSLGTWHCRGEYLRGQEDPANWIPGGTLMR